MKSYKDELTLDWHDDMIWWGPGGIDGKIYAVAFMANAQHLWYRESIFNELGIAVPTTYEEVIAAAAKIKASGKMANPYAGAFKAGWNLSQEFVNMYLGHGGEFFKPGTAEGVFYL